MESHRFVLFGYGRYLEVCSSILFVCSSLPRLLRHLVHGETALGVDGGLRYAHLVEHDGVLLGPRIERPVDVEGLMLHPPLQLVVEEARHPLWFEPQDQLSRKY